MANQTILTRDNKATNELHRCVAKTIKDVTFQYTEVYYLDSAVDEDTGMIDNGIAVEHYTKNQVELNLKAMKAAYMIAKGAVTPTDIIEFRAKYKIAASALSIILGFSKNTISNIENGGITSLPSGRFIKLCLSNTQLLSEYVKSCSSLDIPKKNEILKRLGT